VNNQYLILEIFFLTLIGVGIILYLTPYFKKKFKNTTSITNYLMTVEKILNLFSGALPEVIDGINVKCVLNYIVQGIQTAEQLYISKQISSDDRKKYVLEFVENILKLQNIEISDEMKKFIETSIETFVYLLPKTK
jgi:hypothetical protein